MVAPVAGLRGVSLFQSKNRWRPKNQKKKGLRRKISGFLVQLRLETKKMKKHGLHHKSVELWYHIIIWRHPGRATLSNPRPPSDATDSNLGCFVFKKTLFNRKFIFSFSLIPTQI